MTLDKEPPGGEERFSAEGAAEQALSRNGSFKRLQAMVGMVPLELDMQRGRPSQPDQRKSKNCLWTQRVMSNKLAEVEEVVESASPTQEMGTCLKGCGR